MWTAAIIGRKKISSSRSWKGRGRPGSTGASCRKYSTSTNRPEQRSRNSRPIRPVFSRGTGEHRRGSSGPFDFLWNSTRATLPKRTSISSCRAWTTSVLKKRTRCCRGSTNSTGTCSIRYTEKKWRTRRRASRRTWDENREEDTAVAETGLYGLDGCLGPVLCGLSRAAELSLALRPGQLHPARRVLDREQPSFFHSARGRPAHRSSVVRRRRERTGGGQPPHRRHGVHVRFLPPSPHTAAVPVPCFYTASPDLSADAPACCAPSSPAASILLRLRFPLLVDP